MHAVPVLALVSTYGKNSGSPSTGAPTAAYQAGSAARASTQRTPADALNAPNPHWGQAYSKVSTVRSVLPLCSSSMASAARGGPGRRMGGSARGPSAFGGVIIAHPCW